MPTKDEQSGDVYARVTRVIVDAIEQGKATFEMPWHVASEDSLLPVNVLSEEHYRGINVVALWASAHKNHFESGVWGTYRQWSEVGAQVRRGEKGSPVVFWKIYDKKPEADVTGQGEPKAKRLFVAKGYTVFNSAQVDGYTRARAPGLSTEERIERAEEFLLGLGADIRHGYDRAAYDPAGDLIVMPSFERFRSAVGYYATSFHEAVHWSGHTKRLGRDLTARFGSEAYAMEELVAELGSAFLCSGLELTTEPRTDHAGYVESWLSVLRNDKRAIFTAAAKAQQAVEWLQRTHEARQERKQEAHGQPAALAADRGPEIDSGPEMGP